MVDQRVLNAQSIKGFQRHLSLIDEQIRVAAIGWFNLFRWCCDGYSGVVNPHTKRGTGVGTSVIIEGKLLRGKHYDVGCLGGHFIVNHAGNVCICGNIGCVEAEAATWNLTRLFQNLCILLQ